VGGGFLGRIDFKEMVGISRKKTLNRSRYQLKQVIMGKANRPSNGLSTTGKPSGRGRGSNSPKSGGGSKGGKK